MFGAIANDYLKANNQTAVATTSKEDSGSSFGSTLGSIFNRALDTAATFGSGLLSLELFEKANKVGATNTATNTASQNSAANQTNSGSASGNGGLFGGLPSWAGPAAIGGGVLLVILLVLAMSGKK
ncbi:hypothetical protein [Kordiimonas sp.]|uniref:hypothetical protein n=1 Tax=Kordiimonas sp. TaxID=1970157 RepID=UPI003A941D6A